jgi:hypothetical protein
MTAGTSEIRIHWSGLLQLQKGAALSDVEIIGRAERRRKWTAQENAALLVEVEAEGGKVMVVARRDRISESVLYNWRAAWKAAGGGGTGQGNPRHLLGTRLPSEDRGRPATHHGLAITNPRITA